MDRIRIGCVEYLNTVPLIEGLEKLDSVELRPAVPASLAGMVAGGHVDVGLVSLVDAARHPLALLSVGMIGCDGPTMTVRIYSRVPIGRINRLCVDRESHTSAILCRIILRRMHDLEPRIEEFDARAGTREPEAELLIGDKVVTGAPDPAVYPHTLDLGVAWRELTGLPVVYALWMCRSDRIDADPVRTGAELLDRQRRRNALRLEWIAHRRAGAHGWPRDVARRYLCELLRYEVGPRERAAVDRFLAEASDLGLIEPTAARWADAAPALV